MTAAQGIASAMRRGGGRVRHERTQSMRGEIVALRKVGMSYRDISARCRVSQGTAIRVCEADMSRAEKEKAHDLCFSRRSNTGVRSVWQIEGLNETAYRALALWRCPPFDYVEEE